MTSDTKMFRYYLVVKYLRPMKSFPGNKKTDRFFLSRLKEDHAAYLD